MVLIYEERGRLAEALAELEALFERHPDSLESRLLMSRILVGLERQEDAQKVLREFQELAPKMRGAFIWLGPTWCGKKNTTRP